jgi:hypothetical protein
MALLSSLHNPGRKIMKAAFLVLVVACSVSGCGVETVGTAATAATLKQKEIEAGRKTKEQAEQKVNQAMEQVQQRAEKAGEADK